MKKILFGFCILLLSPLLSFSQIGTGGLPMSFQSMQNQDYTLNHSYPLPNWETAKAKNQNELKNGLSKPYLIGLFVPGNISFPNSGSLTMDEKGNKIWRTSITIPEAPAIGLYFDKYHLPEGVKLFISNQNKQQILGAYTSRNNNEENKFACEAVQGEHLQIELNISSEVNLKDIELSINNMLVYFESISYLSKFAVDHTHALKPTGENDVYNLEGSSSTCNVNAVCALGVNYPKQRKATAQVIIPLIGEGAGLCSATMVNNTGNSSNTCKQYLLTASHCEGSNGYSSSATPFSQMLVRFNFETLQCEGGPAATVNTLTGVKFVARSNYTPSSPPKINSDFLLLELKTQVPNSWDVYMAGWNNAANIPTSASLPKRFIGFHHPSGDVKKIVSSQAISPNGNAGGTEPNTHWTVLADKGGIEQGSSGSGLFDGEGRVIGIASVAGFETPGCTVNGKGQPARFLKYINYSKISYSWLNSKDTNNAVNKLKPWLDPKNSGVGFTNTIKANCSDINSSGISLDEDLSLENAIGIYPNPSTSGIVKAKFNFNRSANLQVILYSITGIEKKTFELNNIQNGSYSFDLSEYANGIYLLKFYDGNSIATKKVSILR